MIISCHGLKNRIITSDYEKIEKLAIHRIFSINHKLNRTIPRIFVYDCCDGMEQRDRSPSPMTSSDRYHPVLSESNLPYSLESTTSSVDKEKDDPGDAGIELEGGDIGKGYGINDLHSDKGSSWTRNEDNPDYRLCTIFAANPGISEYDERKRW